MELSDLIAGLALVVSAGALWYARSADKRAAEEHRRGQVHFEAEYVGESDGVYEFRLINKGTKTAKWPKIDADSVQRYAVRRALWIEAKPHIPIDFAYEKPVYGELEAITLQWRGRGTRKQNVPIPSHRGDA